MTRSGRIGLALVALVALTVRLYGLSWGLPEFYEEAYPYRVAWSMGGWGTPAGLDLNPHFFKYPSLVLYLQLAGQALTWTVLRATGAIHSSLDFRAMQVLDPTPLVWMARAITALFGAATVIPAFLIGRRVGGDRVGFVAALLVALCPALVSKSQVIEVDVPLTFLVAAAAWASLRLLERPVPSRAGVAGLLVGLAASAKYPGALALVMVGMAIALTPRRAQPQRPAPAPAKGPRGDRRARREARRAARDRSGDPWTKSRLGLALAAIAAAAIAFLLTSPFTLLDTGAFLADFLAEREHMQLGHFGAVGGMAYGAYAREWLISIFGWTLGLAVLAGLVWFGIRRERWVWVLGSFVVVYFAIVGSWSMKADRYLLPLVPVGAVFAAALAARAADALSIGPLRNTGLALATALLLVGFAPMVPGHLARTKPDPRTAARAWFYENVPQGALVASEEYGPELRGPMWLRTLDPELRASVLARETPLYATLEIPFLQVAPERSTPLYDPPLYRDVDLLVVSAAVHDRYRAEPARFAKQCAFYDTIESRFVKRARFEPVGSNGSALTIYANPAWTAPFALRDASSPTAVPAVEGQNAAVGFFHFNQGVNHESFGFIDRAMESYRLALRQGEVSPLDVSLTQARIGHCLMARGVGAAGAYLDTAAASAPDATEREALASLRAGLGQGAPALAADSLMDLRKVVAR